MIYEIGLYYPEIEHDAQVKVSLNKISFPQRVYRFWYAGSPISHWNEDSTNTWVKVPVLNGTTKIYLDDSANKDLSNIDETMIFGDDFDETSLDTSKWDSTIDYNGVLTIINDSQYSLNGTNVAKKYAGRVVISSVPTFSGQIIAEINLNIATYGTSDSAAFIFNLSNSNSSRVIGYFYSASSTNYYYRIDSNSYSTSIPLKPANTFQKWELVWDDTLQGYANGQLIYDFGSFGESVTLGWGSWWSADTDNLTYIDSVFAHKYLSTDPKILYIRPVTHLLWNLSGK